MNILRHTPWPLAAALISGALNAQSIDAETDKYLWLEEVSSQRSLDWVKARNDASVRTLSAVPVFSETKRGIQEAMDSRERIPFVEKKGEYLYNFWKDSEHPRGILRRTTLASYKTASPKWQVVLDIDKLARDEKENWVWGELDCLEPSAHRCLVSLTRGGGDSRVIREFDTSTLKFVADGFVLPEAKGDLHWISEDRVFVATNFGEGSATSSGYPRIVKEWRRGMPLASARTVFEGKESDTSVTAYSDQIPGFNREFVVRRTSFFTNEMYLHADGILKKLEKPNDANAFTFKDQLLIRLRTAWTVGTKKYASGSLLAVNFDDFMKGKRDFDVLYKPTTNSALQSVVTTKDAVLVNELINVRGRLTEVTRERNRWKRRTVSTPSLSTLSVAPVDELQSNEYFVIQNDFLTPTSLSLGKVGTDRRQKLKSLPAFFDASKYAVSQRFAVASDGVRIPYFVVARKDVRYDGTNPTLLYGYGGFELSMKPSYSATIGRAWLEKGGVYVLSNIRGGGEFGPRWHEAALKEKRQRSYDDFIEVAEDLIQTRVTSPRHLGIIGGSLGGMLVSVAALQRPELYGAVVSQVPLADMKRYHKMLAGASWIDEYGDPDIPDEWAYISKYSPYHLLEKNRKYPPFLFTSSTRDDRVHPAHARKMVAKMEEQGHNVLYWENMDGGHGGAVNSEQQAQLYGMIYTFLWDRLK